jgi:tRNA-dihydrouridine synthase A
VQEGRFGACLMAEPELVARCIAAMRAAVRVPVTVKCRIGIDEQDSEADFQRFIDTVGATGCTTFIVHARKAWLKGLSPKENREIPPLEYARVYRLKDARPDLEIIINGGVTTLSACEDHLQHVDGVMLGRAAYQEPYVLAEVDQRFYGSARSVATRREALEAILTYADAHIANGGRLSNITRHVLGLYHGRPRGKLFRRHLSVEGVKANADSSVLAQAIDIAESAGQGTTAAAAE